MIRTARLIINKKIYKETIGFPDFQSNRQLIVASRPPAASEYILGKKQPNLEILPHDMNMQGLDTSSVITNVAANYRACHDTVIHEYSSVTDIEAVLCKGLCPRFYCLIVNGERVPPSYHGGAFQLQDKLFHKASLVNSMLFKSVLK
jgi:hypothetical protein